MIFPVALAFIGSYLLIGTGIYQAIRVWLLEDKLSEYIIWIFCGLFIFFFTYFVFYLPAARISPLKITNKGIYLPVEVPLWGKFIPYEKISFIGFNKDHTVITINKKYSLRSAYILGADTSTAPIGGRRKEVSDYEKVREILIQQAMKYPHIKIYDGKLEKWIKK